MKPINPKSPRDFGAGFVFWAYCANNMYCHHEWQLTELDPNQLISDIAKNLDCPCCGGKGTLIHRLQTTVVSNSRRHATCY